MKIKHNIISAVLLLLAGGFALTSCTDGDDFKWDNAGLLISGTENNPVVSFAVEDTPASYALTVQSTKTEDQNVTVQLAIDSSKVSEYNAQNSTTYYPIPASAVELENSKVTISAGSAISSVANVRIVSTEDFVDGRTYVVPVTIKEVSGASEDVIPTSRTIFLRISRVINFYAIEANSSASSNFIFDQPIHLTTFTYEAKIYPTGLANRGPQRFMALEQKDESKSLLLRFNEANTNNQLQTILNGQQFMSNTKFENGHWYLLSWVYDGTTLSFYVNGVLDFSAALAIDGGIDFQRYEMGMSWGGYRSSQFFSHRFCEIRVWNRALSASEIVGGMCGVDAHSDGLAAYWKFNEGQGSTFHDATGHGYDMDWTKSQRDINENGVMVATPDAANAIQWVKDDINKCAQ